MKKLLCILLALTLICALFVGCGKKDEAPADDPKDNVENNEPADKPEDKPADEPKEEDNEPKRILGMFMTLTDAHWQMMSNMLRERFEALGYVYDDVSGENDPLKQIEQIENGVIQGYDLIMVIPVTGEAIADACQKAMDEGVFVYSFINDSVNNNVFRTVDPVYSGQCLADYAAECIIEMMPDAGDGGINTVIIGQDISTHTVLRYEAIQERVKEYPQLNVIECITVEESVADGQAKAENILTKHPDTEINLWICASSSATIGVNAAIMAENSGVDYIDRVCLAGDVINAEFAALLTASKTNEAALRVCAANGGRLDENMAGIVDGCDRLLKGETVDPKSPVNVDKVTPDNLADFGY